MLLVLVMCAMFGCFAVAGGLLVIFAVNQARRDAGTSKDLPRVAAGARDVTLAANGISIVFAKRLAGAVWTMRWKGHDFVGETMGNGGSQQSAVSYDVGTTPGESNEEENPTEAGNKNDIGGTTTSRWTEARKSGTEMFTRTQMAYYYPPGEPVASSASKKRARGANPVSDTTMTKRVSIGYRGHPNVVNYALTFECPSPHWFVQVEALTGYMPRAFNKIYTVKNGSAVPFTGDVYVSSPPKTAMPVIIAKNASTALGVYAHTSPPNPTYKAPGSPWYTVDAKNHAGFLPWDNGRNPPGIAAPFTKWNVVWHGGSQTDKSARIAREHVFGIALVFGSVTECAAVIAKLQKG